MSDLTELDIRQLIPMQDGFRRATKTIRRMQRFVESGGKFDYESLSQRKSVRTSLILLNRFEDGRLFIHDGTHRVTAILLGRQSGKLASGEFEIQTLNYAKYNEINLPAQYFTPFDPLREVRTANFHDFKTRVQEKVDSGNDPSAFILENRHLYARPRGPQHDSIADFVRFYLPDADTPSE